MDFSPASIVIGLLFSCVGYAAWQYGRKNLRERQMWIGVGLMGFGYFVSNPWLGLLIGGVLTVLLFWP